MRVPAQAYVQSRVSARFTAPDGRRRTGQVQAVDGTPKGTAERIWVTWSGDVVPAPPPASKSSQLADLAAAGSGLGPAAFLLVAGKAIRGGLNRRRMATWDAEWAAVEPRWTRQRW
jgi:hypothetical protein